MNIIEPRGKAEMSIHETTYEIKSVTNTPLYRVYVDGVYEQEFTSLAAARAWIEFERKFGIEETAAKDEDWDHDR